VLVCPTTAGAVVAIDIANRTLLWGYQYPREGGLYQPNGMILRGAGWQFNPAMALATPGDRWLDSAATIAGGRVLVTPLDSNELHCLSLLDGKLLWKLPRGEHLYVAGVHDSDAVIVGKHQLTVLKLVDEKPATSKIKTVELPAGALPSGRGFLSGKDYFLPL